MNAGDSPSKIQIAMAQDELRLRIRAVKRSQLLRSSVVLVGREVDQCLVGSHEVGGADALPMVSSNTKVHRAQLEACASAASVYRGARRIVGVVDLLVSPVDE